MAGPGRRGQRDVETRERGERLQSLKRCEFCLSPRSRYRYASAYRQGVRAPAMAVPGALCLWSVSRLDACCSPSARRTLEPRLDPMR